MNSLVLNLLVLTLTPIILTPLILCFDCFAIAIYLEKNHLITINNNKNTILETKEDKTVPASISDRLLHKHRGPNIKNMIPITMDTQI